jgi:vancomycin resistance protein YoaR
MKMLPRGRWVMALIGLVGIGLVLFFVLFSGNAILLRWQKGANRGVTLEGVLVEGMLRQELESYLTVLAREIERPPRSAYLDRETNELVSEELGWELDVQATLENILNAPANSMVLLEVVQLDPEITTRHYTAIDSVIGAYQTGIGGGGGRATNIILATATLNNYLMMPGDLFSFNRVNGPRTAERGYQPAPVIVGNTVVPGLGGGVCQVSSTLYNAVLQAGLEVVERYPHSQPVGYVPPGRDATISDYLDFKFRNSTDQIIMIKAATWGGVIDIRILQE